MIYKYCRRCGKRLKGEENRLRGYGKTCFEKIKAEAHVPHIVPYQLTLFPLMTEQAKQQAKPRAKAGAKQSSDKASRTKQEPRGKRLLASRASKA